MHTNVDKLIPLFNDPPVNWFICSTKPEFGWSVYMHLDTWMFHIQIIWQNEILAYFRTFLSVVGLMSYKLYDVLYALIYLSELTVGLKFPTVQHRHLFKLETFLVVL